MSTHQTAVRLLSTGRRHLDALHTVLTKADPTGLVSDPAALLCCGLAELAESAARARGVQGAPLQAIGRAAACLALLTKLDDEVIDSPSFHGHGPRAHLRERTTRFLAPTLQAVMRGRAHLDEPRVHLAAEVGRALQSLAVGPDVLHALLDLIARGWAIQVDAVEVLSAPLGSQPLHRVERVTADISGAWLAMITAVGLLGERSLSVHEEAAFFRWGRFIQSADALADVEKDLRDDFGATLPATLAARRDHATLHAWRQRDAAALRRCLVQTRADVDMLPSMATLHMLDQELDGLGDVPTLLRWIHGFLLGRHIGATPGVHADAFRPFIPDWEAFAATHAHDASEVACSA